MCLIFKPFCCLWTKSVLIGEIHGLIRLMFHLDRCTAVDQRLLDQRSECKLRWLTGVYVGLVRLHLIWFNLLTVGLTLELTLRGWRYLDVFVVLKGLSESIEGETLLVDTGLLWGLSHLCERVSTKGHVELVAHYGVISSLFYLIIVSRKQWPKLIYSLKITKNHPRIHIIISIISFLKNI